jgi:hypothetical protein
MTAERDGGLVPEIYAARAARAYAAMQRHFATKRGLYRRDGRLHLPGAAAHLWPFIRAFVATLDLAGAPAGAVDGFDADAAIDERLHALGRYWEPSGPLPAYSSDVSGTRLGGDRYYDDNAWVGLCLVQLERMRPGAGRLDRAAELFRFAVGGWDSREDVPAPGGVFWVEQGKGVGTRNHDRNTVSTAPNAQLGLHLAGLGITAGGEPGGVGPRDMYDWVNATLDAGGGSASGEAAGDGPGAGSARGEAADDGPGTGLFWDKIRGDNSVDRKLWSYNQGSMVGLNVLLARAAGGSADADTYMSRAMSIARKALRHYDGDYESQPAAFNAIFFRNLLQLSAATADDSLQDEIIRAMRGHADHAWSAYRNDDDCFRFSGARTSLLDQSAMVQVLALLAWDPRDYPRLA